MNKIQQIEEVVREGCMSRYIKQICKEKM